ncbi:DUF7507 domain-containing protein [Nitratireductor aquimarinus]|uniref:DUF7507 domain-containing protein n=1 Tax=Nitratireductor aquimarinus TaxID=889300 RepID=UPI003B59635C
MTVRVDLYCSRVTTDGTTINLEPLFTVDGYSYPRPGSIRVATCPAGMIARGFYGRHRSTASIPWASQVGILCTKLELKAGQWIHFNTASNSSRLDAGVIEGNAVHSSRGPFCGSSDDRLIAGYARQRGGAGYDGIRAYCGYLAQARLSASIAFSDFAWDQTIGGSGWNTALAQGGTALTNGAAADVYALPGDNDTMIFQSGHELYVAPASNYGALVDQRPPGIAATTYVETGSCAGGNAFTLSDEQDGTCELTINGLPDIGVSATAPAGPFTDYGVTQSFTMTATNFGPGATDGDDGFALVATLPAGWTTSGALPAGCAQTGSTVTCSLDATPLTASSGPGAAGGTVSFDIPVHVELPAEAGDFTVPVVLGRTAPDGDADTTNDDFETGNDSTDIVLSFPAAPSLSILKTSVFNDEDGDLLADPGETISYTFTVENTGNVTLTNVVLTDDHAAVTGSPIATLAPGPANAVTLTGTYTVTQADIDTGHVDNLASATGKDPDNADVTAQSHPTGGTAGTPTRTDIPQTASSDFIKTVTHDDADGDGFLDAGERLNYTFSIENTGNVTLSNITVTDTRATLSGGPIASLAPGVTDATTITGYYDVTQADIDSGGVDNVASMSATDTNGDPVELDSRPPGGTAGDSTSFTATASTGLSVLKTSVLNGDGTITYSFTVENTGNVTLTDVALTDDHASVTGSPIATLLPGSANAVTLTGTYTVTQADIDAGYVDNLASATGKDPDNADVMAQSHPTGGTAGTPTRTDILQVASSDFIKTVTHDDADGDGFLDAGERLNYTFSIENTGNVTLSNITVTDTRATLSGGPIASLAPGATDATTITGYYDVTQADVDSGGVDNVASMSAEDPNGDPVERESRPPGGSPGDSTGFTVVVSSGLSVLKTSVLNGDGTISYAFTVENTGNVTLTNVVLSDDHAAVTGSPIATLLPGSANAVTLTGTYTVTQADVDLGHVDNLASATGKDPGNADVTAQSHPTGGIAGTPTRTDIPQVASSDFIKTVTHDDADGDGFLDAGERLNYMFSIENTGNVTLSNITVTDTRATLSGGPIASLAPGVTDATTITGYYDVTQADIDSGGVDNVASMSGTDPNGDPVELDSRPPGGSPGDSTGFTVDVSSGLSVLKTSVLNGNGTISYTFRVENTGNVTLTDVVLSDDHATVTGSPIATLLPGSANAVTLTGTYTVTQADIDAGHVDNLASATGKDPDNADVTAQSHPTGGTAGTPTRTDIPQVASSDFIKTVTHDDADGDGFLDAGERLNYAFSIENTGNVTLSNITVTDSRATLSGGPIASLAPGATDATTITGYYDVTQADIDSGGVDNVASMSGEDPNGDPVERESRPPGGSPGDSTGFTVDVSSGLSVLKSSVLNGDGTISYTFTVENTGNVTLTDVVLTDDHASVTGSPIATLLPGSANAVTLTGTYTVTQADIDAGHVDNLASATGKDPDNADVTAQSHPTGGTAGTPTRTDIPQTASSDFIKTVTHDDADGDGFLDAGERLNYTFSIENTGNVTLSNVTVTDSRATLSGGPIASLAPGATDATTITGYYDVTQADIDSGGVDNVASMSAEDPNGDPVELDSRPPSGTAGDNTSFTATASTGLSVLKTSVLNGDGTITYSFTVENTGNVTLTDVALNDDHATLTGSPIATLLPGPANAVTLTGTYTVTQADIDAGHVDNLASATGKDPDNADVTVQSHPTGGTAGTPTRTDIPQVASSDFIKTVTHDDADGDGFLDAGERLNYTFSIENTGNVTLSNITVTDSRATLSGGPIASLAPGVTDATTITGYYDVTQADIDSGGVDNVASMSGEDPNGDPVELDSRPPGGTAGDNTSFTATASTGLSVLKTSVLNGDGTITYSFTVENTGNVTLTDVALTDDHASVTGSPIAMLAPGSINAVTLTGTYTVTQADIDAGHVDNLASATGKDPGNADVTAQSHPTGGTAGTPTRTDIPQVASSDFIKTVTHDDADGDGFLDAGERLNYTFSIENTGNVTLSNVTVTDTPATLSGGPIASLAPGATDATTITGYYDVTQADIDSGSVDNVASMSATDPNGDPVELDSRPPGGTAGDSTSFTATASTGLSVLKTSVLNGDGTITYSFTVENTGNVTLTDVALSDDHASVTGSPIATLLPGSANAVTLIGTYTVTQADIDAGHVDNLASATGKDPDNADVTAQSHPTGGTAGTPTRTDIPQVASSDFIKTVTHDDADGDGFLDAGERLNYMFSIENTGNVTLSNITVTDTRATLSGGPIASLAPGATDATTITGYYDVTQADIDSGSVDNVASMSGEDPNGDPVELDSRPPGGSPGDSTGFTVDVSSGLSVLKTSVLNGNGTISYTFRVENTGNVTLTDVVLSDDHATVTGSPIATLLPGSANAVTLTGTYTVTQADVDLGHVDNLASATGKDPGNADVTAQSHPTGGIAGTPTRTDIPQVASSDFIKTVTHDDADGDGFLDAGERLNYMFSIENTGNVTLSNITVTDTRATLSGGPIASLAPGVTDATTITGYYDVTQADIDSGSVDNIASMSGEDPKGDPINQDSRPSNGSPGDSTGFTVDAMGLLSVVKEASLNDSNGNGLADRGEFLEYRFTVTNTGNVTLSDINVEDDRAEISGSPITSLAPGQSDVSVTGRYRLKQADIDAGSYENLAAVSGTDPHGEPVFTQSSPLDGEPGEPTAVVFKMKPFIELDLTDEWVDTNGSGYPDPSEPVKYTFTIRNTGNVTVGNITIDTFDVQAASGKSSAGALRLRALVPVSGGTLASLAPGDEDSSTFSASYLLTQSDIDAGKLIATAQTVGVAVNGTPVSDISDDPHDFTDVDTEGDEEPDDPTVTVLPQKASLALMKTGEFQGSGEAIAQPGDTILYTFTVTNDGNVSLADVTPVDAGPRFNERPAKGRMSSFSPPGADLGAGESAVFTATYTLTQGDIAAAQGVEDGVKNTATASATGPQGQSVTAPEAEGVVELPGYAVSKTTALGQVRRGSRVPYTIRVKMLGVRGSSTVNVVDMTPPGLVFAPGSARLGDTTIAPVVAGRKLVFNDILLKEGEAVEITLELLVTSAAKPGEYVNRAWVEDLEGTSISRIATAAVEVVVEAMFDCGDIIGRVFDDRNRNGYQDRGEPGLAGVRVATVKGLLVTADAEGRFHIPCADLPDQRIGTNYILKLDTRSLPSGYRLTTENPRVVRLTAGKASRFLFGASVGRVMRLDLSDAAFEEGGAVLRPEWQSGIARMIDLLNKEPSSLRLVYTETGEGQRLAQKRIKAVRKGIASEWRRVGARYRLDIEIRVQAFRALPDRPQRAFGYR